MRDIYIKYGSLEEDDTLSALFKPYILSFIYASCKKINTHHPHKHFRISVFVSWITYMYIYISELYIPIYSPPGHWIRTSSSSLCIVQDDTGEWSTYLYANNNNNNNQQYGIHHMYIARRIWSDSRMRDEMDQAPR